MKFTNEFSRIASEGLINTAIPASQLSENDRTGIMEELQREGVEVTRSQGGGLTIHGISPDRLDAIKGKYEVSGRKIQSSLTSDFTRVATGETYQGKPFTVMKRGGKNSRILLEGDTDSILVPNHELWPDQYAAPEMPAQKGRRPGRKPSKVKKKLPGRKRPFSPRSETPDLLELPPSSPPEWVEPQPRGEDRSATKYSPIPFERAKEILINKGFQPPPPGEYRGFSTAAVYAWRNPYTGQMANLKHETSDKRGRPVDNASIVYHVLKENRSTRRTPQQKYRDNYVQYD
jgi:hypothetical protein